MLYDASHVEDACDVTHGYVARLLSATLMAYEASSSVTKRDAGDWPLT